MYIFSCGESQSKRHFSGENLSYFQARLSILHVLFVFAGILLELQRAKGEEMFNEHRWSKILKTTELILIRQKSLSY